jgi:hypothetical protein
MEGPVSNKPWIILFAVIGCLLVAGIVVGQIRSYQRDHVQTWTYVTDDSGVVIFETESRGYQEFPDDWTTTFKAVNPDGSTSTVQTQYSVMTFPFKVQVFEDTTNGVMKFARSYSGNTNQMVPEPIPSSSSTP